MTQVATGLWTPAEEKVLEENASLDIKELEGLINRSRKSIRDKAYRMGIKLTGEGGKKGNKVDPSARKAAINMLKQGIPASKVSQETSISYGYCYKLKKEIQEEESPSMSQATCNSLLNSVFG